MARLVRKSPGLVVVVYLPLGSPLSTSQGRGYLQ
jgi:hypothetical protein